MSHRTAAWLAWSLWAVCVALIALALLLDFLTDDVLGLTPGRESPGIAVLTGVLSLAYPTVGALIASRLPTNPIGWIFCGVGLFYVAQRFSTAYADYALNENLAFPGGEYVAWFSTLIRFSGLVLTVVFVMLLFPNGRLLSHRWQIVAWMAILGAVLTALYDAFYPDYLATHSYVMNPFGVEGYIGPFTPFEFFIGTALVGEVLLLSSSLAALLSLFLRLHRARGDERQQLKWFLYAAVPAGVAFGFVLASFIVVDFTDLFVFSTPLMELRELILSWDNYEDIRSVGVIALLVIPVFTYIAILRHRLYDIDVVINRTLVYGSLTALLVGVYVGSVVLLQGALRALTGQESQLAVVASTLLIAAIFNPLRGRIQAFVDRRFYRRKYDAAKTLAAFSAKLTDETDLDALSDDLVGVVRETMQPAHVSLWLRPDTTPQRQQTN